MTSGSAQGPPSASAAAPLGDRIAAALAVLGSIAERDSPLGVLTTYRVGGRAAIMVRPQTVDDLGRVADAMRVGGLPALVIGRGSNMLVADAGFDGIAISLADLAADHRIEGTEVVAGAMARLPQLARQVVAAGLTGFEWAVGVPGSIGGAVRMNAGGHGSDIKASLVEVVLFDLSDCRSGRVAADRLGLRFRGSDLADHQVVLEARLQLRAGERDRSERELDGIVRWRHEHQPGGQNAGSVFVNPIPGELSAGELIDRAGLRGTTLGTATVSEKHANFIQASEGGNAADVLGLIELVRRRVADVSGYVLRSEIRLVGFPGEPMEQARGVPIPVSTVQASTSRHRRSKHQGFRAARSSRE